MDGRSGGSGVAGRGGEILSERVGTVDGIGGGGGGERSSMMPLVVAAGVRHLLRARAVHLHPFIIR